VDLLALVAGCLFIGARLEALGAPQPWLTLGLVAVAFAYPVLGLRYLRGTPGQRLFGVEVVSFGGGPLSWKQAFRRVVGQLLLMGLLMVTGPFGFIWLMVRRSRGHAWWHDKLAGTRLIRSGEPDPGPTPPPPPLSAEHKRILLYLVLAVVGGLALIGSVSAGVEHFLFAGRLHLVAPRGAELRVQLDAEPAIVLPPGTHLAVKVDRGAHVVSLRLRGEETSQSFQTSGGFWHAFTSVEPDQCFVMLDVSDSHYGAALADGTRLLPGLEQRYQPQLVVLSWLDDVFFDPAELPESSQNPVKLVTQLGCEALSLPDEDLLRGTLGHEGRSWREINADPPQNR
jgi:uncharacterized RDD family membrane protein YckC